MKFDVEEQTIVDSSAPNFFPSVQCVATTGLKPPNRPISNVKTAACYAGILTGKKLSYRRETRATLCSSWNIGLLLYE